MLRFLSKRVVKAIFRPSLGPFTGTARWAHTMSLHDISPPDPKDYDVLITDLNDENLRHEVAEVVGIPYHSEVTKEDATKIVEIGDCYLYGQTFGRYFQWLLLIPTVLTRCFPLLTVEPQ